PARRLQSSAHTPAGLHRRCTVVQGVPDAAGAGAPAARVSPIAYRRTRAPAVFGHWPSVHAPRPWPYAPGDMRYAIREHATPPAVRAAWHVLQAAGRVLHGPALPPRARTRRGDFRIPARPARPG